MKYTKFFNSNPSVSGNNAMSNIEALAKFDTWLAGQEIINISVGESQDTYTPLTFTKENGETYTVNIPTVKGATGDTGLKGLSIIKVYESATIPAVGSVVTLKLNDFNRTPTTNERAVMFVVTDDNTAIPKAYITSVVVNSLSGNTINCVYESVQNIALNYLPANNFNYKGEWVQYNEYHKNDCVYVETANTKVLTYYICIKDISNSILSPVVDTSHWNIISTNASKYFENYYLVEKNKIDIETSTSFPIGSNNYIHFVTLNDNKFGCVANTFCITNSNSAPSIDDFISFLRSVAPNENNCFMANGKRKYENNIVSIVNGVYSTTNNYIFFRGYYISD